MASLPLRAHAQAAAPVASGAETPLQEIAIAASALVRSAPLPAWADLAPLPPATPARRALAVRLDETHLRIADTPAELHHIVRQVNDAGALGQLGQISIVFAPAYQRLLLHKVLILRGTGFIDHTSTAPVRFLQREAKLEQGIYSGLITATLLLPDVRVGDTLQLQYTIEGANPIFGKRYANIVAWEQQAPVQVRRVTVSYPESRPVQWAWMKAATPTPAGLEAVTETRSADGLRQLRYEQRDVPGVELEAMLPRGFVPVHLLQFSEFQNWADVARWADTLFPPDAALPAELVPVIQRLLRLPTQAEQASQALQWVQSEIRYYSVSLGESSHRPHSPVEVLRNRYGDCKDKSFLLMRMLQSLGMQARPVLAALGAPQRPAGMLASPLAFDHAVVQLHLDGRDYFLDPTRLGQRGPLEHMGQGLEAASVLVVTDPRSSSGNSSGLQVVNSPNRKTLFRSELSEQFRVTSFTEPAELETVQQWFGVEAEQMRLTLARFDPVRLQRAALSGIERRYPGATLLGTPVLTDTVAQNRITLQAHFQIPKLVSEAPTGWAMRFAPVNLQGALVLPPSAVRTQPLALPGFPRQVIYSAEVQWPDNVSGVGDAVTQRVANAQFTADVTRSFRANLARTAVQFEALAPDVAARDVPQLLIDMQQLNRLVGGVMAVDKTQVKDGGFLGLGRKSIQETLQARALSVIERTGKSIVGSALTGDDLAEALCSRAEALAELGRFAEAQQDTLAAGLAAPALARSWQCQANVNWSNGDFAQAETGFGKALTLGLRPYEAYLRRGQARFYAGRLEQAAVDFGKAAADRSGPGDKPFARLWQAWTLAELGQPLPADTLALATEEPPGAWPQAALAMFTGRLTPQLLLQALELRQGDDRELALAEAWFYIGQWHRLRGETTQARDAFEQARGKGITSYTEHVAAGFELKRLAARP